MHKLFVYGTLKKQHSRSHILSAGEYLGEVKTLPKYTMVDLGSFPGLLEIGDNVVYGELYQVDNELLGICDEIEGHPNFYFRKSISLSNKIDVWAYFLDEKYIDYKIIKNGVWT
jgi:gamma-glutamylcyclotransferase (GGCT)/AIG2-like uncharacterized protein YtfP